MNDKSIDTPDLHPRLPADGGPAFPIPLEIAGQLANIAISHIPGGSDTYDLRQAAYLKTRNDLATGASLRDYFAIHATAHDVQIVTRERPDLSLPECRYAYADAMLRARVKP